MLFDCKKIIATQSKTTDWHWIATSDNPEEKFLYFLLPAMDSAVEEMLHDIKISSIISAQKFRLVLEKSIAALLQPMIGRVCVIELHYAKEDKYLEGNTAKDRFNHFIEELKLIENQVALLDKYPILETQINIAISQFIETKKLCFQRLLNDKNEVYEQLLDNDLSYQLENIFIAGDKHRNGQEVIILTFRNNELVDKKIVYKPRSLKIDMAFQKLIRWFNAKSNVHLFEQRIINKKDYGWCQFIENEPCNHKNDVKYFYHRLGELLLLVYLLDGSDLHFENIIAHGDKPVIIDYECFFKPFFLLDESDDKEPSCHFVTDTWFLPRRVTLSQDGPSVDMSAFGFFSEQATPFQMLKWENAGTDEMYLARVNAPVQTAANYPFLSDGNPINPTDYQKDFQNGFISAYNIALNHLESLKEMLIVFKGAETRILFRNTSDYGTLLAESFHPMLLHDRQKRVAHFNWLAETEFPEILRNAIITSEVDDLNNGNIPAFFSITDQKIIYDGNDKEVLIPVIQTGYDNVMYRIDHVISESDLKIQKTLIKHSFSAMCLNLNHDDRSKSKTVSLEINENKKINRSDLRSRALHVAKEQLDFICNSAIINRGRVTWPLLEKSVDDVWNVQFTDVSLYSGVSGIILALAYGAKIFNDDKYDKLSLKGLSSLRKTLFIHREKCCSTIGPYSGLSGILYTFLQFYQLKKEPKIKEDIHLLLTLLLPAIKDDNILDIIAGSAGCLVVLFRLQKVINDSLIESCIRACVDNILNKYPTPSVFPEVIEIKSSQPLLGFSHGVAGILWALAQYAKAYPNNNHVNNWIRYALEYERINFSNEAINWPDYRILKNKTSEFMTAWCHGAPGIGLSRYDLQKYYTDNQTQREVNIALEATLRKGFGHGFCLCHGDVGNLELLFVAEKLNDTQNYTKYCEIADKILTRIESETIHFNRRKQDEAPELMTGLSGVAYQLMRLAEPGKVPSILLLETAKS